jgi:hypothetical protein
MLAITVTLIDSTTGCETKRTVSTLAEALTLVRAQYPDAVDVTGDWAGCGGEYEERQIVADDSDDAPTIATLRRLA